MFSPTVEHVHEVKSVRYSHLVPASFLPGMLDHRPGSLIVQTPGVKLEITGDACVQFMQSLMQSPSQEEKVFGRMGVLSIQLSLPVENVPSLLLVPVSEEPYITMTTGIQQGWSCSWKPTSR